jgi:hypothetical protein
MANAPDMPLKPPLSSPPAGWARAAYCLSVPGAALVLFGALAALWHWGRHSIYFNILGLFGFHPFRFPFLDIHYVLAAAECWRQGFDIYLWNPCDALGRPLDYSPLWLRIIPSFLGTGATTAVGLGLGLLFIASLALVCRPCTRRQALVLALVALSPMTVYALERANADVAVFLLVLAGCALSRGSRPWRLGGYAFYFCAGLLKFYPLVVLVLLARERWRDAIAIAAIGGSVLLLLAVRDRPELVRALANLPAPSYFTDSFSAANLPFGAAKILGSVPFARLIGILVLADLVGLAIAISRRALLMLNRAAPDWTPFEAQCLIVGALVLVACFFAGQNIDYRGIYFVLVMAGLVELRRTVHETKARRLLSWMITAVLFVAWEQPVRWTINATTARIPIAALRLLIEILFWLGRELVWWWLIAGLGAIVLCYLRQLPRVVDTGAALVKLGLLRRQLSR